MPSGTDMHTSDASRDPTPNEPAAAPVAEPARRDSTPVESVVLVDALDVTTPPAPGDASPENQPDDQPDASPENQADASPDKPADAIGLADTHHGAGVGASADESESDELATLGMDTELASTEPAAPRSARARRSRQARYRRGATIGRYIVLDTVGAGTMGTVYAAYDPELDRRIAVKLLSTSQSRSLKARMRLLREARALARLSHPNVIQVYDVGVQNDDVFVAMELIEGSSLDHVTAAEPRPGWRQVVEWFIESARGLAAAHAVGIIHRDFKPSNVLIGRDGRVRVADFGLAAAIHRDLSDQTELSLVGVEASISAIRTLSEGPPVEGDTPDESSVGRAPLDAHITDPGTIMGTPAFMAPEQHSGDEVGPQADQYSFCVALYAGLYGYLPFPVPESQRPMVELLTQKVREQIAPPPAGTEVPAWLHAVVIRGMAARPEQRWPSMTALMDALMDDPVVRRRRVQRTGAAIATVAVIIGLGAYGWLRPGVAAGPSCQDSARYLAGVWDESTRQAVRGAFQGTARPYASVTFERVAGILDDYAADWTAMRTEACEATFLRKEQSEQTLDLRMYCLHQRRSRLSALTQLLAQDTTTQVLDNSVRAAMALPPVDYCGDIDALMATIPPPEDPGVRATVEALQARLDRADALADNAGRYREALVEALAVLDESKGVTYLPIQARAMFLTARMRRRVGDTAAAEALLRELVPLAARVQDDALVARAWSELLWGIGYVEARHEEALALSLAAEAAVERTGDDLLRADLWLTLGAILYSKGEYGRAAEYETRALDAQESALGPKHPDVAQALNNLAVSLGDMDDHQAARPLLERALAIRAELLGPKHPLVAQSMTNLAHTMAELGELAPARELHERAVAVFEESLGPAHWLVGYALDRKAYTLWRMGEHEEARVMYERAIAVREAAQGKTHPGLAESLLGLGEVLLAQGNPHSAVPAFERALELGDGAGSRILARSRFGLARALWDAQRDQERALALGRQALDDYSRLGRTREQERVARWLSDHRRPPDGAGAAAAAAATPR
jgi:serine/threonine protein kinase/tetratricopeptide (TPR) repeat protein